MGGLSRLAARENDVEMCAVLHKKAMRRKELQVAQLVKCKSHALDPPRKPRSRLPPIEWSKGHSPKIAQLERVVAMKHTAHERALEEEAAKKAKVLSSEGVISTWVAAAKDVPPSEDYEKEFERIEDARIRRSWEDVEKRQRRREEEAEYLLKHGVPPPQPVRTTKYLCAMGTNIHAEMSTESRVVGHLEFKDTIDVDEEIEEWMHCPRGWVRMYNPRLASVKHFKKVFIPNDDEMASRVLLSGLDVITLRVSELMKLSGVDDVKGEPVVQTPLQQ